MTIKLSCHQKYCEAIFAWLKKNDNVPVKTKYRICANTAVCGGGPSWAWRKNLNHSWINHYTAHINGVCSEHFLITCRRRFANTGSRCKPSCWSKEKKEKKRFAHMLHLLAVSSKLQGHSYTPRTKKERGGVSEENVENVFASPWTKKRRMRNWAVLHHFLTSPHWLEAVSCLITNSSGCKNVIGPLRINVIGRSPIQYDSNSIWERAFSIQECSQWFLFQASANRGKVEGYYPKNGAL